MNQEETIKWVRAELEKVQEIHQDPTIEKSIIVSKNLLDLLEATTQELKEANKKVEALMIAIRIATKCVCGKELSPKCSVCDNDE